MILTIRADSIGLKLRKTALDQFKPIKDSTI